MAKPNMVFIGECAVDGCYKNSLKGFQMCESHQTSYDKGEILTAFYGKKVQKKEFQSNNKQS